MKDTYYFSHDYNAKGDEKCEYMIHKFGLVFYGLYWIVIEKMHASADGKLTCALMGGIAKAYNIEPELLADIYNESIKIELFLSDGEKYWSERVLRNKEMLDDKRAEKSVAGRKGAAKRWGGSNKGIKLPALEAVPLSIEAHYKKVINPVAGIIELEKLQSYSKDGMEDSLLRHVMDYANSNNVRRWSYINKILDNCYQNNIKTLNEFNHHKAENSERSKSTTSNNSFFDVLNDIKKQEEGVC